MELCPQVETWILTPMEPSMSPTPEVTLIGRTDELDVLRCWLEDARSPAAVVGTAGVGKTALLRGFVEHLRQHPPIPSMAVAWIDLSVCVTPRDMLLHCARTLHADLTGEMSNAALQSRIHDALVQHQDVLVIFDHVEHLQTPLSECVEVWNQDVSSRILLWMVSQHAFEGVKHTLALQPLSEESALMFMACESELKGFDPEAHNATLLEVVRALEGLPLAIELAASQLSILTPEQLLSFSQPMSPAVFSPLSHTLERVWSLLSEAETQLIQACSVFRGSFELAAARAVSDSKGTFWVLHALEQKSILRVEPSRSEARYQLHRSVRVFASQHAPTSFLKAAETRHLLHYSDAARSLFLNTLTETRSAEEIRWLARETHNLQAALERQLSALAEGSSDDPVACERALYLTSALISSEHVPLAERSRLLRRGLELPVSHASPLWAFLLMHRRKLAGAEAG